MKIIRPAPIGSANMSSNIPEATYQDFSLSALYGRGERVTSGGRDYESLATSNTGHALSDPAYWLDLGPTNRFRMFDSSNGTATTDASLIDVTVQPGGRADGLALLNLVGQQVRVIVDAPAIGTVRDQTISLLSDGGITSWYDYFTEEITYGGDLVLTDLPMNSDPTVRVIVTSAIGSVAVGNMVLGQTRDLGVTGYGAKAGIQDYSRKQTDEFGNTTLLERTYAKRTSYRIQCEKGQADALFRLLTEYRARPVVWIGSEAYQMTWTYGWARDWAVEITYPSHSMLSLEVEGLT